VLVLANAHDAMRLAGLPLHWLQSVRGQVSWCAAGIAPRVPVASCGYALTLPDGRLLFGATSQAGDADPRVRESDHQDNRAKAALLTSTRTLRDQGSLQGRVGFRAATVDRLPLVGLAPDIQAPRPLRAGAPGRPVAAQRPGIARADHGELVRRTHRRANRRRAVALGGRPRRRDRPGALPTALRSCPDVRHGQRSPDCAVRLFALP
jgi:hypothetical protein